MGKENFYWTECESCDFATHGYMEIEHYHIDRNTRKGEYIKTKCPKCGATTLKRHWIKMGKNVRQIVNFLKENTKDAIH